MIDHVDALHGDIHSVLIPKISEREINSHSAPTLASSRISNQRSDPIPIAD